MTRQTHCIWRYCLGGPRSCIFYSSMAPAPLRRTMSKRPHSSSCRREKVKKWIYPCENILPLKHDTERLRVYTLYALVAFCPICSKYVQARVVATAEKEMCLFAMMGPHHVSHWAQLGLSHRGPPTAVPAWRRGHEEGLQMFPLMAYGLGVNGSRRRSILKLKGIL
ncbi:hypothetical protein EDB83DRAFT_2406210, partial [Lactarius deliciosus]